MPDYPDASDVVDALRAYVRKQRNPLLDRLEFYNRQQDKQETFDSFYAAFARIIQGKCFLVSDL